MLRGKYKIQFKKKCYLNLGALDEVTVLVTHPHRDFGRPTAPDLGRRKGQLARIGFDDGLGLQPSGQSATGGVRYASHEFSEETVFVAVHSVKQTNNVNRLYTE